MIVRLGLLTVVLALLVWFARQYTARAGRRTLLRARVRLNRYKFARKRFVVEALMSEPELREAVEAHMHMSGETEDEAWRKVRTYLDEIVPFFNVLAYYKFGYGVSRALLKLLYRVTIDYERPDPFRGVPRDAIVIYVMNHRSNADYVVVAYALVGDVSVSYAVGEWARAFPLEYIFKAFGSYFVRRKFRDPLYHAVLSRYVQLITRNGVTQGIFPEGGLTRDGKLQPPKIGLLDYALQVAKNKPERDRMVLVPVGINYDRVLEDRSLLRELAAREGRGRPNRLVQIGEVFRYITLNVGRLMIGRWQQYGRAAVTIGAPVRVTDWLDSLTAQGVDLFALERGQRLQRVQEFSDNLMERIGALLPVSPVPLACAALQTFDSELVMKDALLARMSDLRDVLPALNARPVLEERSIEAVFESAWLMLRMRRVLTRQGDMFVILPKGRELISYYANSVAHLLGPYAAGIRARDALPASSHSRGLG